MFNIEEAITSSVPVLTLTNDVSVRTVSVWSIFRTHQ